MNVDQKLVQAIIDFINTRFPTGDEGAAAVYLEDGQLLIATLRFRRQKILRSGSL